jgi:hypothetical protein
MSVSKWRTGPAGTCDCAHCRCEMYEPPSACVCQGAGRIEDSPCQHCEAGAPGFSRDEKDAAEQLVKGVA